MLKFQMLKPLERVKSSCEPKEIDIVFLKCDLGLQLLISPLINLLNISKLNHIKIEVRIKNNPSLKINY